MAGVMDVLQNMGGAQPVGVPQGYQDPVQGMNFLEKLGLGLGGIDAVNAHRTAGLKVQETQREGQKMDALRQLAEKMKRGEIDQQQGLMEYAGITGDYSGLFGVGARAPAAIQEWQTFNSMSPEDQQRYLQMKRANQMFDRGGSQVIIGPDGQPINEIGKTLPPQSQPANIAAAEQAKVEGQVQGEKNTDIGKLESQAQNMLYTIDQLFNPETSELQPGVDSIVGGIGGLQGRQSAVFPVTENQRKYQPFIDQIKGQSFLEAYQSLKGGGQITEVEGKKAEQAIARLNQAQDEKDFAAALRDLREVVNSGLERARSGVTPKAISANPVAPVAAPVAAPVSTAPTRVKFGDLK